MKKLRDNVAKIHEKLQSLTVVVPRDPTLPRLRELYGLISEHRSACARIYGWLAPKHGTLKAEVERLDARIKALEARHHKDNTGGLQRNQKARAAHIRVELESDLETLANLGAELALVGEALQHTRLVMDELQAAYEGASRTQASIELEWKIESNT